MIAYESANGKFPPGRMGCDKYTGTPCGSTALGAQRPGTSAFLAILPQLDDSPTYALFAPLFAPGAAGGVYPAVSDSSCSNWTTYVSANGGVSITNALLTRPPVFVCPSDIAKPNNFLLTPPTMTSSYVLVQGELGANAIVGQVGFPSQPAATTDPPQKYYNNGPFVYQLPRRSADIRDGLSQTMFVGETIAGDTAVSMNSWVLSIAYLSSMRSTNNPLNTTPGTGALVTITNSGTAADGQAVTGGFNSMHPSGANFAFGDAHVTYLSNLIDFPTYQALSTIAGSEPINPALVHPD